MNLKKIIVLLLSSSLLLTACGNKSTNQAMSEQTDTDTDKVYKLNLGSNFSSYDSNTSLIDKYKDKNCIKGKDITYTNIGDSLISDLNNDGIGEDILLKNQDPDFESMDSYNYSLTINGKDYKDLLSDIKLSSFSVDHYCIVDLDTSDSELELAIPAHELIREEYTYFFHYKDGELKYIGCIDALIDDSDCNLYGDGSLSALIDVELLENSKTVGFYELKDDQLMPYTIEWYYTDPGSLPKECKKHNIQKNITVYKEKDLSSEKVTLTPKDGPVTFPSTDNRNWFMLNTKSEDTYYIYLEDSFKIREDEYVPEYFDQLYITN